MKVKESIEKLRKEAKKRNFSQSFDLIINLRNLDFKKPEHKVDSFIVLPNSTGREIKICGLVDKELVKQSNEVLDYTLTKEEFSGLKREDITKLSRDYDYFVAQANLMTDVAKYFGRIFGPKGKMPNPKSGCIVLPNADLKVLKERLKKTVRIQTKNELIVKTLVGTEKMKDEEIVKNVENIYDVLVHQLPQEKQNIRNVLLKLSMSKPVEVKI